MTAAVVEDLILAGTRLPQMQPLPDQSGALLLPARKLGVDGYGMYLMFQSRADWRFLLMRADLIMPRGMWVALAGPVYRVDSWPQDRMLRLIFTEPSDATLVVVFHGLVMHSQPWLLDVPFNAGAAATFADQLLTQAPAD